MNNHRPEQMSSLHSTIRLADIDPDLLRAVSDDDDDGDATRVLLPVIELSEGVVEVGPLLSRASAFGGLVLEGMLQHYMRIGDQVSLRVLGPGELIAAGDAPRSMLLAGSEWRAHPGTRLALLGDEFLLAARRWPSLYAGLQVRMAEQFERLSTQLTICQLPRVEDRLLAMLWHLAESWGRVTAAGTTLPLSLTHEALGALVGARRSTVTLALGDLAQRGALVHQDRGWLLLERPPRAPQEIRTDWAPSVLDDGPSGWSAPLTPAPAGPRVAAEVVEEVRRLRADHARHAEQVRDRLRRVLVARERAKELRETARAQRRLRNRPPSS
jgi:CRP/FNR family cyclic AMP-dependent transcriptional regulator